MRGWVLVAREGGGERGGMETNALRLKGNANSPRHEEISNTSSPTEFVLCCRK